MLALPTLILEILLPLVLKATNILLIPPNIAHQLLILQLQKTKFLRIIRQLQQSTLNRVGESPFFMPITVAHFLVKHMYLVLQLLQIALRSRLSVLKRGLQGNLPLLDCISRRVSRLSGSYSAYAFKLLED